jgi:glycosyltransferase involved in cell wall biosynthesis
MKISKNIKLIVPSQHTKYSLKQKFSDLDIKSISVLYSPKNYLIMDKNSLSFDLVNTKALPKKYFLLISGDRWIKNGIRMIKAIDNLYSNNNINDYKTIVLGVKDERIFNFVKNKKSFEFKSYVSYEDLERYYFNSFAFLYPSLNEGFGYPPLDAMKYKIPVITSAISSVTEICDNGVLYFNPFDISEMENRILQITYDHNIYKDISEKGYKRFLDVSLKQQEDLKKAVNLILKKDVPY